MDTAHQKAILDVLRACRTQKKNAAEESIEDEKKAHRRAKCTLLKTLSF